MRKLPRLTIELTDHDKRTVHLFKVRCVVLGKSMRVVIIRLLEAFLKKEINR